MNKRLKRHEAGPATASRHARHGEALSPVTVVRRRRWFRLAAVLFPVIGVVLLELALRLIGFGYPTGFLVHHPATGPELLVENQRFPWRFFPRTLARHPDPIVISPVKPAGVFRILVLGESAAAGDPAPAFGFSRFLQVLLEERYPAIRFELVNTAFTAINSHVIVPMARDCRQLQADVWLVYMGNNEVVGPFGAGTVLGRQAPPMPLVRAGLALKTTRTGELLDGLMQRLRPSREADEGWGGMSMFLKEQVRRDDPRLADLQQHFQENLRKIIDLGRSAGAGIIVSTMVSRLRDWPPFGSLHRIDLTEKEQVEWERLYQAGIAAELAGDLPGAIRHYEQAAQFDDEFAELHFRWGRCELAMENPVAARRHFVLARDLDTLRFRADSRLNEMIRDTMNAWSTEGIRLIDAAELFDRRSTNGITGGEWLHEHVHFTFAGNYVLARLFAEEVTAKLPESERSASASAEDDAWLSEAECADRLGYTDLQRHEIANLVLNRFDEPIYRGQVDHAERVRELGQELARLRGAVKPAALRRSMEICRQALKHSPGDWRLHELAARLQGHINDDAAAGAEWRKVSELIPHAAGPHSELGKLKQRQGDSQGALVDFSRAIEVNPDHAEAHVGLGTVYSDLGRSADAARSFRKALQLDPTRREAVEGLAKLSAGTRR